MNENITLRISILGKIWWPMGLICSQEKIIRLGKGLFQVDINPVIDEVENWILSHSGDFSDVIDWQCDMELTHWEENKRITEFSELKPWNDEEIEFAYLDTIMELEYE